MTRPRVAPPRRRIDAHRAVWWTFALYPVAFVAAFVIGEALLTLYGFEAGAAESPPAWAILGAGGPALVAFCIPAALAVHFARRAAREGRPNDVGLWVSVGLTGLFLLPNLVGLLFA